MPPFLRLNLRTTTWLANAERVVGQALPTPTSGPFAVITLGPGDTLGVLDSQCY